MRLITVEAAREAVKNEISRTEAIALPLLAALGRYAAADIPAPSDSPRFDNAAMDGYAFAHAGYMKHKQLRVTRVTQAGDAEPPVLAEGEAARIFTGAQLPQGADTVVMQERASVDGGLLRIDPTAEIAPGKNVRRRGSQFRQGACLVPRHARLDAAMLGRLAEFGITTASVFAPPRVGVMVTGNELAAASQPLRAGQIYESNSVLLQASLRELRLDALEPVRVRDDRAAIMQALEKLLPAADVLLITGGISVGDYDFVRDCLEQSGVRELFYQVQQKPGKPLYFGKLGRRHVFAMPGNPAAAACCFYHYVRPFLAGLQGCPDFALGASSAALAEACAKSSDQTVFLKGRQTEGRVRTLSRSEEMTPRAANCWVELTGGARLIPAGETVQTWKI